MRISFEFTNRKRLASIRISKIAYDIRHNVYNSFDIESSNILLWARYFKIVVRRTKEKDVTSKFVAESRESWPLFPTSPRAKPWHFPQFQPNIFDTIPLLSLKNASALFPAPSQISKSRERDRRRRAQPWNRGYSSLNRRPIKRPILFTFAPARATIEERSISMMHHEKLLERRIQAFTVY